MALQQHRSTTVPGSFGAVLHPLERQVCDSFYGSGCTLACVMISADLQIMGQQSVGCLPNEGLLGYDALPI